MSWPKAKALVLAAPSATLDSSWFKAVSKLLRYAGNSAYSTVCAALARATSVLTGPVGLCFTRKAGVPSIAAKVSYWARLTKASTRVAMGGSVTSWRMASSVSEFQVSATSELTVPCRVTVIVACLALPAASAIVRLSVLTPSASATSESWNSPPSPENPLMLPKLKVAPTSAMPVRVTREAAVMLSPGVPVSELGDKPTVPKVGAAVSSVKLRLVTDERLPSVSSATKRKVWLPSRRIPPAKVASC